MAFIATRQMSSLASLLGPRPDATYTMPGERRVFAGLRSASMPAH